MWRDHPRMGGEKARPCIAPPPCRGSPPHGRGKERFKLALDIQQGITPAWAGKSLPELLRSHSGRDHPRMGGEKGHTYKKRLFGGGITPAWAGKSPGCAILSVQREDHPRMGGEKPTRPPSSWPNSGSPPHGRGKDMDTLQTVHDARITPAWAGKSCVLGLCFELF